MFGKREFYNLLNFLTFSLKIDQNLNSYNTSVLFISQNKNLRLGTDIDHI